MPDFFPLAHDIYLIYTGGTNPYYLGRYSDKAASRQNFRNPREARTALWLGHVVWEGV